MSLSPLWTNIEWDREGRQLSALNLEHSVHRSAYGIISIPVAVFKNGEGPTLLLMAGSHGDEYEGQAILTRLIQTLDLDAVSGRIIVLPAANLPAAIEGTRVSPIDGGNLNRCFGDSYADSPTSSIARFITEDILPITDVFFDFHSGGTSLYYQPCTYADLSGDSGNVHRTMRALQEMKAPVAWIQKGPPQGAVAGRAAQRSKTMYLSGEFGGGGALSHNVTLIAEGAIYRLMAHLGIYPLSTKWYSAIESRLMTATQNQYFYAQHDGIFEPVCEIGDDVRTGQLAGTIIVPEMPDEIAFPVVFPSDGKWICRRAIGRVKRGDCLGHLLVDADLAQFLVP